MQYRCKHCHGALNTDFRCQSCGRDNTPRLPLSGSTPFVNEWLVPDLQWKPPQEPVAAEPTLEEVLAELELHGEIHLQFSLAWACELIPADERESIVYVRAHDTPLQAARECLRGVKE